MRVTMRAFSRFRDSFTTEKWVRSPRSTELQLSQLWNALVCAVDDFGKPLQPSQTSFAFTHASYWYEARKEFGPMALYHRNIATIRRNVALRMQEPHFGR